MLNQLLRKILSISLILSLLTGCTPFSRRHGSSAASISAEDEQEIAIGRQIHESIISRMPVYGNQATNDYVRKIGQGFVPFVARRNLPYHFSVLNDTRIFATSAPGGYIYITTGFIAFLDNEAELAGVLAHEMGELQHRDPQFSIAIKMLEKTIAASSMVAPVFGSIGALAMLGLVGIHSMVSGEPNKTKRLEKADELALQYMLKAGQDPQGLFDAYYKILNASPRELMDLFDYQQSRTVTLSRIEQLENFYLKIPLEKQVFETNRNRFLFMTKPLHDAVPQPSS